MKKNNIKILTLLIILAYSAPCAYGIINVLLVDDSEGQSIQTAWTSAITDLGHSATVETLGTNANTTSNLNQYDLVIWSVGDRAYENLTAQNWSTMTQYANGGGKLIYAGGHSVYDEDIVGHTAIESFFGVTNTRFNMPMWGTNTAITGTSTSTPFGTATYQIVQDWAGGQYGDMFSGFGVSTGTALVNQPIVTNGAPGPYVVAQNSSGSAQLWGLDLNHINAADREIFLQRSFESLAVIPEPSATGILLGIITLLTVSQRRKASNKSQ